MIIPSHRLSFWKSSLFIALEAEGLGRMELTNETN